MWGPHGRVEALKTDCVAGGAAVPPWNRDRPRRGGYRHDRAENGKGRCSQHESGDPCRPSVCSAVSSCCHTVCLGALGLRHECLGAAGRVLNNQHPKWERKGWHTLRSQVEDPSTSLRCTTMATVTADWDFLVDGGFSEPAELGLGTSGAVTVTASHTFTAAGTFSRHFVLFRSETVGTSRPQRADRATPSTSRKAWVPCAQPA